jgi:hypothetical protein
LVLGGLVVNRVWRNQQQPDQSIAAVVAMTVITLVFTAVAVATLISLSAIPDGRAFDAARDDRLGGLLVAAVGWGALIGILAWIGFVRRPNPSRYSRPLPPPSFLASAAVGVAATALAVDEDTFASLTIGAGAWCWIWVAYLALVEGDPERSAAGSGASSAGPDLPSSDGPPPATRPQLPGGRHRRPSRS